VAVRVTATPLIAHDGSSSNMLLVFSPHTGAQALPAN